MNTFPRSLTIELFTKRGSIGHDTSLIYATINGVQYPVCRNEEDALLTAITIYTNASKGE